MSCFSRAVEIQPTDVSYLLLAQALEKTGQTAEARSALQTAQRISGDWGAAQQEMGRLLEPINSRLARRVLREEAFDLFQSRHRGLRARPGDRDRGYCRGPGYPLEGSCPRTSAVAKAPLKASPAAVESTARTLYAGDEFTPAVGQRQVAATLSKFQDHVTHPPLPTGHPPLLSWWSLSIPPSSWRVEYRSRSRWG